MNTKDLLLQHAPGLPEHSGSYMPVYFEPVQHSGERFTVAIAAQDKSQYKVIQAIDPKVVRCMYANNSEQVQNYISLIITSLNDHLRVGEPLKTWRSPIGGVTNGPLQETYSNKGLEGILFQAITSYASLYQGKLLKEALADLNQQESEPETENTRLITTVRQTLIGLNQEYKKRFNQTVHTRNNCTLRIDYLGAHYNAGLSNFNNKNIKHASLLAQQKLYQLEVLRADRKQEGINANQSFELLVSLGVNATDEQRDQFGEIERSADTLGLRVIDMANAQQIVQHILKKEAA